MKKYLVTMCQSFTRTLARALREIDVKIIACTDYTCEIEFYIESERNEQELDELLRASMKAQSVYLKIERV